MFETFSLEEISRWTVPKGFVHIGAHYGEESAKYGNFNVLWFEAHPEYAAKLLHKIKNHPFQVGYQALLSDVDDEEVPFYITADEYASSMLEPGQHQELFPHAKLTGHIPLTTVRFDTFIERNDINIDLYNILVLDVQGAELHVLRGMGDLLLDKFPVIICEYSRGEIYKGGATLDKLDALLSDYNRVAPDKLEYIGDALYVRKT